MQLKLFKTLWGFTGDFEVAIEQAVEAGFQGLEGAAPADAKLAMRWKRLFDNAGLDFIAEITTAGSYVPDRNADLQEHLDSLESKLEHSLRLDPLFITCLGGCDAWPEAKNVEFFSRAMELANAANCIISFETHRGRALFNPWITERIVAQLPEIKLTCDFSHWCVVCERLMDTELEVLQRLAPNAWHIHARIGYDQGPQVPHPAAPEYHYALRSHQDWWELIWRQQIQKHWSVTTMTPEFGPDGYLHETPFSREPVADLWEVNQWMAQEERRHFAAFLQS
ncbi:MAG: sugar phosphate isomerase/epimerase family protein [Gammaproteobacteria bacterium]